MNQNRNIVFGLIGYPLSHSFSKNYFSEKFRREHKTDHRYELFPLPDISELPTLLIKQPNLAGLNVTIPHKQSVIPFLDELDEGASEVGAVNVIQIRDGKLKGYNSDTYGFEVSLRNFLAQKNTQTADIQSLILGTGGASKAIAFVLKKMGIPYSFVSRREKKGRLTYQKLTSQIMAHHHLIINCTPLGTYPKVDFCPDIPYEAIHSKHFFYDLVYNPAESLFLQKGKAKGASTCNGLDMLHLQAERSWEIWDLEKNRNFQ